MLFRSHPRRCHQRRRRVRLPADPAGAARAGHPARSVRALQHRDRKSTRLNSSHVAISYAVFCLKKKKRKKKEYEAKEEIKKLSKHSNYNRHEKYSLLISN